MGYFSDSRKREERIGGNAVIEGRAEEDGGGSAWSEQAVDNPSVSGTRSWQDALDAQDAQANAQREAAFDQQLAGYQQLEDADRLQKEAIRQNRGTALLAAMNSCRQNGGTMNPALNQAVSEAFGFPVTGAFLVNKGKMAGTMVFGTPQKDAQTGQLKNNIGMMISPAQRYQIFKRLNTRQAVPYMQADYAAIKQQSGLTDIQLAQRGFTNPEMPVVGGTTDGKATSRLFGVTAKPKPRSAISATGFDGRGGGTRYESNAENGFQMQTENFGTRKREQDAVDTENAAKIKAAGRNGISAQDRLAELELKEKGKNERQEKSLASKKELQENKNENEKSLAKSKEEALNAKQYEAAVANWQYRANEHIRKMMAEIIRTASGAEVPKYSKEEIEAERARLDKEFKERDVKWRKAYKQPEKTETSSQQPSQSGQAPAPKEDNSGDGNVIDTSGFKTKEELNKALANAPEGSRVTLDGKTKVKRGKKWVEE